MIPSKKPNKSQEERIEDLEARCEFLESQIITGWFEDETPSFKQGLPVHELEETLTVEDCVYWTKKIRELMK